MTETNSPDKEPENEAPADAEGAAAKVSSEEAAATEDAPKAAPKADAAKDYEDLRKRAPLPGRIAYPLALLSGVLYFLGFPGIDFWPISLVALVPLIIALKGQPARRATGLGWTAGMGMTMCGFYWLLEMLKVFSGFPTLVCVLFMTILCGYQSGRIALAGWLYGRAEVRGWPAPVIFALAFAASELVYPLLFPWYFGASVHNFLPLLQVAELGGPILVGLVLVATNLAVAELVIARREGRPIHRVLVGVGVAAPIIAALFGYIRLASVREAMAAAKPIKVGIVQGNQALFNRANALAVHKRRTLELKQKGAELIVWSEAAVPKPLAEPKYKDEVRAAITRDLGVPTIVGTVLRRPVEGGAPRGIKRSQYFNTALLAEKDGSILGRYDKQFLLAFGEYLPLGDRFPILYEWSPNSGQFTPGSTIEPFVWGEHRISALICYEDIIPSFVNKIVRHADPDLLVNLTNDAWFGDSTEPWIHLALAKLRAVEHRRFLIRATNSGVSAIIDATGGVVTHGGTFREEVLMGEARFMRATTGYKMLGDYPWYAATAAILVMAIWSRPKRRLPSAPKA
jgi:apolipoprotein N-acyltransferase